MKYSVAVDLGGTNIGAGVVREDGRLISKVSALTPAGQGPEALIRQVCDTARAAIFEAHMEPQEIAFAGIGIPGVCKSVKGPVILAPNIGWKNIDCVPTLEAYLGMPVYLENDADCAALGEAKAGAGVNYDNLLMLTVGTGIGGGVILGGKLFAAPLGGEYGHVTLVHGGLPCSCGKRGCFECYASAVALKRETRKAAEAHPESLIWKLCEGDLSKIGGRTPFDAAEQGDETGEAVVEQYLDYLADGISGFVNIFRPQAVVIGGGVSNQGDSLLIPLEKKVAALCYASGDIPAPKIIRAFLGNDAGIIGAGMLGF
ncbi:MAG TPA: ROK family protein [Oscillospiraceae bacterium]|nr:ROK family protein [Oscillospiraceae bacterium]HNW05246.1 ROK family protein [Oscillospiraceae bacterium]